MRLHPSVTQAGAETTKFLVVVVKIFSFVPSPTSMCRTPTGQVCALMWHPITNRVERAKVSVGACRGVKGHRNKTPASGINPNCRQNPSSADTDLTKLCSERLPRFSILGTSPIVPRTIFLFGRLTNCSARCKQQIRTPHHDDNH